VSPVGHRGVGHRGVGQQDVEQDDRARLVERMVLVAALR
jgi:hypothetical protein